MDQTGPLVFLTVIDTIGSLLKLARLCKAAWPKRPFLPLLFMKIPRWNSGRAVGPRTAFTQDQIAMLIGRLEHQKSSHDLALLTIGIDTMLRASDLLCLKVQDIAFGDRTIRTDLHWRQQKTGANVTPTLTSTSQSYLTRWIIESRKSTSDFCFTGTKPRTATPITPSTYRRKVKTWATLINLDPTDYSSHSVRRTKAIFMYRSGCPVADISKLLGHRSTEATMHYLGLTTEHLRAQALKYDVFTGQAKTH